MSSQGTQTANNIQPANQSLNTNKSFTNSFNNNGGSGSYVSNNLNNSTTALQAYNPSFNSNINNTGSRSSTYSNSYTVREIDINSFMWYFIISVFIIISIVLLLKV